MKKVEIRQQKHTGGNQPGPKIKKSFAREINKNNGKAVKNKRKHPDSGNTYPK
jgi:hypothetical protein